MWQLMKAKLGTHLEDDSTSMFCSQLIGESLKTMGILPSELCSSNMLPSHFEEKENAQDLDYIDCVLQSKLGKIIVFQQDGPVLKQSTDLSVIALTENFAVHSVSIQSSETATNDKGNPFTVFIFVPFSFSVFDSLWNFCF